MKLRQTCQGIKFGSCVELMGSSATDDIVKPETRPSSMGTWYRRIRTITRIASVISTANFFSLYLPSTKFIDPLSKQIECRKFCMSKWSAQCEAVLVCSTAAFIWVCAEADPERADTSMTTAILSAAKDLGDADLRAASVQSLTEIWKVLCGFGQL